METIKRPKHYIGDNGLEVNEVLAEFLNRYDNPLLAHYVANAIEYLLRAPSKNGANDVRKAHYNLSLAVEVIDRESKGSA